MPFPALTALGFTAGEDSKFFMDWPINPSMAYETDGGLYVTRRRFTRDPGIMIRTGFTFLTQADKTLLDTFYKLQGGPAQSFIYQHPTTALFYNARFVGDFQSVKYAGAGTNFHFDVEQIDLRTDP